MYWTSRPPHGTANIVNLFTNIKLTIFLSPFPPRISFQRSTCIHFSYFVTSLFFGVYFPTRLLVISLSISFLSRFPRMWTSGILTPTNVLITHSRWWCLAPRTYSALELMIRFVSMACENTCVNSSRYSLLGRTSGRVIATLLFSMLI